MASHQNNVAVLAALRQLVGARARPQTSTPPTCVGVPLVCGGGRVLYDERFTEYGEGGADSGSSDSEREEEEDTRAHKRRKQRE